MIDSKLILRVFALYLLLMQARVAYATQVHAHPEGLYVHQLAHFFFILSMGTFIYWLRGRDLTRDKGWRLLQYCALCFIFWNADAMLAHYLESQDGLFTIVEQGGIYSQIKAHPGNELATLLFYFAKMDHFFCVPGIIFLYAALRYFLGNAKETFLHIRKGQ
ncbi:hypothetical protein [Desulfovulcanus sp.]